MNIYDIAKEAGVSIATVSRVINGSSSVSEKTRKKIEDVMLKMGYKPNVFARGLMTNSMMTIGIMTIDVRDLYYANSIYTVDIETRRRGYDVIVCSTGENIDEKKKHLKLLLQKRVDGIILVGSVFKESTDNSHIIEAAGHVPVVMVNGYVNGKNIYSVVCDDCYATYSTVNMLIEKGHKEIIYIYDVETFSGFEKLKGFKKSMIENNLKLNESSIIKTASGINGGYMAVDKILKSGIKFSALVAGEDILAAGALKRLAEEGINVPGDVAITGFNNSIISMCTRPELTSVNNKVEEISSIAVSVLIDAIEGKEAPEKTVVKPEIIVREST